MVSGRKVLSEAKLIEIDSKNSKNETKEIKRKYADICILRNFPIYRLFIPAPAVSLQGPE